MGEARYLERPASYWGGLLASDDPLQRRLGAYALGELGASALGHRDDLAAALADPVTFVRVWAAAALLRVDARHADAFAVLLAAVDDDAYFVRSLAAWLLGRLGAALPAVQEALPALRRLQEDDDVSVRTEASFALARLDPEGVQAHVQGA